MKWLLAITLAVALLPINGRSQWITRQQGLSLGPHEIAQGDFDRPHPAPHRGEMRQLSAPATAIPNWPFPNVDVTNDPNNDQTEPSISINPTDSLNIVIASNDDRNFDRLWVYTSLDGGLTWKNQSLPPGPTWVTDAFDPSVVFNRYGVVYVMYGELDSGTFCADASANDIEVF
ncbi:MAG TPA: hypothetical protein VFX22_04345, partial [Candidatus Kapabacteria bacterium]|nr:hypothetical protein [Candidatus Kapabacteria bacterium]